MINMAVGMTFLMRAHHNQIALGKPGAVRAGYSQGCSQCSSVMCAHQSHKMPRGNRPLFYSSGSELQFIAWIGTQGITEENLRSQPVHPPVYRQLCTIVS